MKINPLKGMVFSALFAAFTAAIASIKIPLGFTPVPITLQTLAVLLSGAVLGPYYGALAMILYLLAGAIGLPVFAGGSGGIASILGPTGGYLLSYPVAAFVIGWLVNAKKSKAINYTSLAILAILLGIIYVDLFSGIGIMKKYDGVSKSYVGITSSMQFSTRITIGIISLAIIAGLIAGAYYLTKKNILPINAIIPMIVGSIIIYIGGSIQGKLVTGAPWEIIFAGWVLPFLIGDTLKLLVAAYLSRALNIEKKTL